MKVVLGVLVMLFVGEERHRPGLVSEVVPEERAQKGQSDPLISAPYSAPKDGHWED